jgi:excisionase family DNA binding protein
MEPRFLSLADVCEVLQVPMPTVRALVRSGELRAIQIGGKGTWRVERTALESYIEHRYAVEEQRLRDGASARD